MSAFLNGLLTGGSLIIAIGSQNAYVLKQGLLKSHVFVICLICSIADALLILIGISGIGKIISSYPQLLTYIALLGAIFLFIYGSFSFRDAIGSTENLNLNNNKQNKNKVSLKKAIAMVLALTFLNPHVYLDTVLLIGSIAAPYADEVKYFFTLGAISASFLWFFSLGYGARLLTPLFSKAITWKVLNIMIGVVMWAIAWQLLQGHF